jgi:hypothetical protein
VLDFRSCAPHAGCVRRRDLTDPLAAWTVDRARALGFDPPPSGAAGLWCPTFHPAFAVRLVALGADGWWLEGFTEASGRLDRRFEDVLPPDAGAALLAQVAAAAAGPRAAFGGEVRDGLTGAAWVADGRAPVAIAGHFSLLGDDDPLRRVTGAWLAAVESRAPGPVSTVRACLSDAPGRERARRPRSAG